MATKKQNTNLIMGVVAGAIASRFVGSAVGGILPSSVPSTFSNVIPIAAGIYLSSNKNDFAKGAGYGMIAAGGSRFLGELIPAIGNANYNKKMLGYPANQSILSLPANQSIMSKVRANKTPMRGIVEPK